jgi:hypothetical protein
MGAWAVVFPQDFLDERAFYTLKKVEHRAEKDDMRAQVVHRGVGSWPVDDR